MMLSNNIEKSAVFLTEEGRHITVDAGRYEWQIIWDGPEWSHCRTQEAATGKNLEAAIAYLKAHRADVREVEDYESGSGAEGEC